MRKPRTTAELVRTRALPHLTALKWSATVCSGGCAARSDRVVPGELVIDVCHWSGGGILVHVGYDRL